MPDLGAAYGTLKSGVGITSMGTINSEAVMKNIIPVVMAGVLGIYGLIIAVILTQQGQQPTLLTPPPAISSRISPPPFPPPPLNLSLPLLLPSLSSVKGNYGAFTGYAHLAAGLSCGLSGMGAGFAIGIVGDAGVRANGIQPKMFVPMVLILIFAEALGLYGLIIGIIMSQQVEVCTPPPYPGASEGQLGQYGTHDGGSYGR